jgi:uncharacterized membrane protein HdeD (DUF308 family)
MHVTPISFDSLGRKPIPAVARRLSRNWTTVLLNGTTLILAGVLIFSIKWSVESLAVFIGALFVLEGLGAVATTGIDNRDCNAVIGMLSAAAGIAMITWPSLSLTVIGIILGGWLTVVGTLTISGAFAGRRGRRWAVLKNFRHSGPGGLVSFNTSDNPRPEPRRKDSPDVLLRALRNAIQRHRRRRLW